ncbi:MAG TPA: hypothetical protein PKL13_00830 [bacterium]|nr:hypothetical protein [bacterium]
MGQKNYIERETKQSIEYRDSLAKKLREEPNKDKKRAILANEKMFSNYVMAQTRHNDKKFYEEINDYLETICLKANSYNELIKLITEGSHLKIINDNYGFDRIEHIIKRLKMAVEINDLDLIPTDGGLREKVISLLYKGGFNFSPESNGGGYKNFLKNNYSDLKLNNYELESVEAKLPPDVFASVDKKMENIVLLLNSLDGTKTKFSCSGHFENEYVVDGADRFLQSLLLYLCFDTNNQDLINEIRNLESQDYNLEIEIEPRGETLNQVVLTIDFNAPPQDWILKNNKKSYEEIFEKSKKLLEEYFGTTIYSNNKNDLFNETIMLQRKLLSSDFSKANLPFRHNSNFLLEISKLLPYYLERKEYKDYFDNNMLKIIKKRDVFIEDLQSLLLSFRNNTHL